MRIPFITITTLFLLFLSCQPSDQGKKISPVLTNLSTEDDLVAANNKADVIHKAGVDFFETGEYEHAIEKYKKALSIRRKLIPQITKASDSTRSHILKGIFKGMQNQSNCYYENRDYESAYEVQEQCLRFLDSLKQYHQVFDWEIDRSTTAYHYMGRIQIKRDKLEEALRNYQIAHTLCIDYKGNEPVRCRDMYVDYSEVYVNWQEADSIIRYAKMALNFGINDIASYKPFINCGAGYFLNKQYLEALAQYDSVLANNPGEDLAKDHHNRALLYLENNEISKSWNHILQAIAINKTSMIESPTRVKMLAGNYSLKGDILRTKKEFEAAEKEYDKALTLFTGIQSKDLNSTYIKNINTENLYNEYKINILEAIQGKSKTLFALNKFPEALSCYETTIQLTNRFRQSFSDQSSKIKLAALTKKIFEGAIEVCLALSKEEQAFRYAEQSKSSVLLESVLQLKAMARLPDINPALQKAWNDARTEISRLNKELNAYEISSPEYTELRKKMKTQEDELGRIEQELQKNEAYTKLTTTLTPPDVSLIQNTLLEDNQAFAEYFIGENQSYLFYIPKNGKLKTYRLNIDRGTLAQKTDSLLFAIRLPHADTSSIKDKNIISFFETPDMIDRCNKLYAQYASELYDKLLAVVRPPYVDLPKRLIIIPDDVLGYLPFDALLTNKPAATTVNNPVDYASYPFLWKSPCHISYCYSGALLKEMRDNDDREGGHEMLVFAHPQRGFKKQLQDLKNLFEAPWSLFAGNFKVIKTKDQLKESVQNVRYLHFSTHGHVDDRNPNYSYLDMRKDGETSTDNNRLYLFDIYNLKAQHTAMVVTSACETGFGRLNRGEGIISLARGFSSAGASSIITTLWSVYQAQSGELFNIFYQNLQDGKTTKDEALSNAKASFVEKNKQFAAPYYWASIVPVGEMEPVVLPQKSGKTPTVLLGGLAIALIIGLFLKKSFIKKR